MTVERFPEGMTEQKRRIFGRRTLPRCCPSRMPLTLPSEDGQRVTYVVVDTATLLYLVNQGTLTFHPLVVAPPAPRPARASSSLI